MQLFVIVLLAGLVCAQEPTQPVPEPQDAASLVRELGHREFAHRDKATAALKALGVEAKAALDEGSKSADLEVSTRCKMLLKELGGGVEPRPLREVESGAEPPSGENTEIIELPRIQDYRNIHEFFEAIQKHNEKMLKRAREGQGALPPTHRFQFKAGPQASFKSVKHSDGARVEVERKDESVRVLIQKLDAQGEAAGAAEVYEAASEEEFRAKYPEIAKAHLTDFTTGLGGGFELPPLRGPGWKPQKPVRPEVPSSGPVLGITMESASNDLCEHVDVPKGTQRITSVQSGSLAERVGVQVNDLILSVDGAIIHEVTDVREAMTKTNAPAEIQVQVVRKGARIMLKGLRKS